MTPVMLSTQTVWYVRPTKTNHELQTMLNELQNEIGVEIKYVLSGAYTQFSIVYTKLEERKS